MSRVARVVGEGIPNHVILRGNNRRRICSYPSEYRALINLIEQAARKHGCSVHSICVMANHLHLIVTPPTAAALSAFVQRFAQRYAQRRNARRDGSGKLFEQRFSCDPITDDGGLARCTAYLELNPVAAGIVDDPADYRWSTYRLYACDPRPSFVPAKMITPTVWYLQLGEDSGARARAFVEFVAALRRAEGPAPEPAPRTPRASGKRLERPSRKRAA
jgi:putative transposase